MYTLLFNHFCIFNLVYILLIYNLLLCCIVLSWSIFNTWQKRNCHVFVIYIQIIDKFATRYVTFGIIAKPNKVLDLQVILNVDELKKEVEG